MKKTLFAFLVFTLNLSYGQNIKPLSSSEILHQLKKLNVVGNALYLAAHPDDENTVFITYLANEKMVRTGYMALTRGDGGQNLVGSEQSEYVGLLRTHELLGARAIDGGEQFFSRANDYGFTKTTDEAVETWGRQEILSDIVWRIRKFQPDVIINRFPPDNRAGHGHHSASAVLSKEAFVMAADSTKFPEQLKFVKTWQAKRLVWNSYSPGFQNNSPEGSFIKISIGDYNQLLGKSYAEIAAEARSMHKSQGFGSAKVRNQRSDYALHVLGEPAKDDILDGIDLSWNRIKGGGEIGKLIDKAILNFNVNDASKSVSELIVILNMIEKLEKNIYTEQKIIDTKTLIANCLGLFFEANANDYSAAKGDKIKITANATSRSNVPVKLLGFQFKGTNKDSLMNLPLGNNIQFQQIYDAKLNENLSISQPYWLVEKWQKGLYNVENQELRGLPMKQPETMTVFSFEVENKQIDFITPLRYKYVEPSDGEIYKYFEIRPDVMANIEDEVYAFSDSKSKLIKVLLKAGKSNIKGKVALNAPIGWTVSPKSIDFEIKDKNQEKKVEFMLTPPQNASEAILSAVVTTENGEFNRGFKTVSYKHVPELNLFPISEAKIIKLDLKKKGSSIAYISGAGDKVPAALQQIGYQVSMLDQNSINADLSKFDAIVVGVRAYNTEEWLKFAQSKLMDYVKNGGTMLVQYQTNAFYGGLKINDIGPYPFGIGRNRVSREEAEMKFLKPAHPLLNLPNKITNKDFDGWIQERGLYFSDKWDAKYETIFTLKDPSENENEGSTLYTKYGKGHYVFTSLAFFRQLPAGVPGAYRLFTNMLSVGKK